VVIGQKFQHWKDAFHKVKRSEEAMINIKEAIEAHILAIQEEGK
jgi:predicted RNase H-like HicB family nuclease